MKKILVLLLAFCPLLSSLAFTGCTESEDGSRFSVVTTVFPEYDWVKEIIGDNKELFDLTLLLDNKADLHNYQPTAEDIIKIGSCDMFIYVGGHSDEWVDGVLAQAQNDDMIVLNLMELLGDSAEHSQDEHHREEEGDGGHVHEKDEHIWLSLRHAKTVCTKIADSLATLDPENADDYQKNASGYCEKLSSLDEEYQAAALAAQTKTLLFGDRFPFRYLAEDYGITYYSAFEGCSADSEASFETIAMLAGKVDELALPAIMKIEGSDGRIAKTIQEACTSKNVAILAVDSLQTTSLQDAKKGASYLSIMKNNLEVFKKALGVD